MIFALIPFPSRSSPCGRAEAPAAPSDYILIKQIPCQGNNPSNSTAPLANLMAPVDICKKFRHFFVTNCFASRPPLGARSKALRSVLPSRSVLAALCCSLRPSANPTQCVCTISLRFRSIVVMKLLRRHYPANRPKNACRHTVGRPSAHGRRCDWNQVPCTGSFVRYENQ